MPRRKQIYRKMKSIGLFAFLELIVVCLWEQSLMDNPAHAFHGVSLMILISGTAASIAGSFLLWHSLNSRWRKRKKFALYSPTLQAQYT